MQKILRLLFIIFTWSGTSYAEGSRQHATPLIPEKGAQSYDAYGYSAALRVGDTIYVSGIVSRLKGEGTYAERYRNGLLTLFKNLETIIAPAGATLDDVIEMTSFHTDMAQQIAPMSALNKELMKKPYPVWTAIGTTGLAVPSGVTEIKFTVKVKQ